MFDDKVWAMIHNRFKGSILPSWNKNMDAAAWWMANEMGDPYAEDEQTIGVIGVVNLGP